MTEASASTPGRVNLIGEHTDYHEGFVLPCPIPLHARVRVAARSDEMVRASSREAGGELREYAIGREARTHTWIDYVQGMTYALRGVAPALRGFDLRVESDVPLGSGLSSSAALEVSVLRALRALFALPIDDVAVARIAHRGETEFVGAPVGIMDQMVCSVGSEGDALFLDTRTLVYERVPIPPAAELVIINSGIEHRHAAGTYAVRRHESFEAAQRLGVAVLRDATSGDLPRIPDLPPLLARRARHVTTENERVLAAVAALKAADLPRFGMLLKAAHRSMSEDYEASTPEIDSLVALCNADPDVYGARLTGGGFGGSVVLLSRAGTGAAAAQRILARHQQPNASILLVGSHV